MPPCASKLQPRKRIRPESHDFPAGALDHKEGLLRDGTSPVPPVPGAWGLRGGGTPNELRSLPRAKADDKICAAWTQLLRLLPSKAHKTKTGGCRRCRGCGKPTKSRHQKPQKQARNTHLGKNKNNNSGPKMSPTTKTRK